MEKIKSIKQSAQALKKKVSSVFTKAFNKNKKTSKGLNSKQKLNLTKVFSFKGINGKILAISVGSVLITVLLLVITIVPMTERHLASQVNQNQVALADRLVETVEDYVVNLEMISKTVAEIPDLKKGDFGAARSYLFNYANENDKINRISVYDLDGYEHIRTSGMFEEIKADGEGFETAKEGTVYDSGFQLAENGTPIITMYVPIFSDSHLTEVVGVIEVEYTLRSLWAYTNNYIVGSTGGAMVLDSQGFPVAHRDNGYVYTKVDMANDLPWEEIKEEQGGTISYTHNDIDNVAAFAKIAAYDWVAIIYQGQDEVMQGAAAVRSITIKLAFAIVLLAIVVTTIFVAKTFKPLKELDKGAQNIAQGDLRQTFKVKTNDEIGELASSFEIMVNSLKDLLGNSLYSAELTEGTAKELSIAANEAALASQQISTTVEEVAKGAEQQTIASQRVVEKINQVSILATEIAQSSETATKINQQMVATIESNMETMVLLINALKEIIEGNVSVTKNIEILEEEAQRIGKIITVVTEIAGQTNLLALNAAIEAARAGDAGRGFAVVADEVRKLSEETSTAATEIKNIVSAIQNKVVDTSEAVTNQSTKAEKQFKLIDQANTALDNISKTSKTTLDVISQINTQAKQQEYEVDIVVKDAEQVAMVAEQTSAASEEVSATTQQQTASLQEITAAVQSLGDMASDLKEQVNKFKL